MYKNQGLLTGFNRFFLMILLLSISSGSGYAENSDITVTGLERLITDKLDLIKGKNIGIIANHTAIDSQKNTIAELLKPHANIKALFGPEHGFKGNQSDGDTIQNSILDGIPIFSLYGEYRIPTPQMLKDVDILIYDIQDVGVRFYTFISGLYLALSAAKREEIKVLVLDRPNPVNANRIEGPVLNPAYASYVGVIPISIRYGMTVGEMALLMNKEPVVGFSINADVTVIPMKNYCRDMWYDQTGLPWITPSPNIPTLNTAVLYPGLCLIEGTNISEGRGTKHPFEFIGAPYIDSKEWIRNIPAEVQKGVKLNPVSFTPKSIKGMSENPKQKGKICHGIQFTITDRDLLNPIDLTVALLCAAKSLYPEQFKITRGMDRLWGDESLRAMVNEGYDYKTIMEKTTKGIDRFEEVRKKYLLYD